MIILPSMKGFPLKPLIKDPFFSSVAFLMHCDGSQGGTIFTDSSSANRLITIRAGTVVTTQSAVKFGTASLNTSAGVLSFSKYGGSTIDFTSATWTVEFWMNSSWVDTTTQNVFNGSSLGGGTNSDLNFQLTNGGMCFIGGTNLGAYSSGYFVANAWYHIALVKSGGTFYYFINGSLYASDLASNYYVPNNNFTFWINNFNGFLDDIRITMGVARYTSNFSVPILAFPNS
jgi:hypothetical protein